MTRELPAQMLATVSIEDEEDEVSELGDKMLDRRANSSRFPSSNAPEG